MQIFRRPQIFNPENIVRRTQNRSPCILHFQRLRPCLRISQSRLQPFPQPFLKFRRFMIQRISSLLKDFNLPAFTAEHNGIHTDRR